MDAVWTDLKKENEEMLCHKCTAAVSEQERYAHAGQLLCEDCYITAVAAPKTCDPWAVYAATRTKAKGETLTQEQQRLLDLITAGHPVTCEQICAQLVLSEEDFRASFATLRHMELAQARKIDDQVVYIPFQKADES